MGGTLCCNGWDIVLSCVWDMAWRWMRHGLVMDWISLFNIILMGGTLLLVMGGALSCNGLDFCVQQSP